MPFRTGIDAQDPAGRQVAGGHAEVSESRTWARAGVDPVGVLPAEGGDLGVGPPAALDEAVGALEERTGIEAAVGRGGRHQGGPSPFGLAAEHGRSDAGPLAQRDGQVAVVAPGEAVDAGHDDAVDGLIGQVAGLGAGQLTP